MRNEDDSESLLNFSVDAGDVIIHRMARRFILRRGKLTGCVVNLGYAGGDERLESGPVAPDVERRVQGGVPLTSRSLIQVRCATNATPKH